MEVSDFCVWGNGDAVRVVFNTEPGNYYSKSTFIVTLRETCVHFGEYLYVFTKKSVPKITKNAQHYPERLFHLATSVFFFFTTQKTSLFCN